MLTKEYNWPPASRGLIRVPHLLTFPAHRTLDSSLRNDCWARNHRHQWMNQTCLRGEESGRTRLAREGRVSVQHFRLSDENASTELQMQGKPSEWYIEYVNPSINQTSINTLDDPWHIARTKNRSFVKLRRWVINVTCCRSDLLPSRAIVIPSIGQKPNFSRMSERLYDERGQNDVYLAITVEMM